VSDDNFGDLEYYVLHSAVAAAIEQLRPDFPRWRGHLLKNGIERVSIQDAKASNLMTDLIKNAMPKSEQDQAAMHNNRNILSRQGAPTFEKRGWKE